MRRFVPLVLVVVLGCSSADPATSLLKPGTLVMAYRNPPEKLYPLGDKPLTIGVGTRLRVAHDPGPVTDLYRTVHIVIDEGSHQGEPARLNRNQIRTFP